MASPLLLLLLLLFLSSVPLTCLCQSTNSSSTSPTTNTQPSSSPSNVTSLRGVRGCGTGLNPIYRYLCDRRAAWGIILEALASAGFLFSAVLLLGFLLWSLWPCVKSKKRRSSIGGSVASTSMFLLATAGLFGLTFSFIVRLTDQTCPTRVFLFSVLFSLAFSCLLARCLALLGFAAARGWGEPAVVLGLFTVQVIISAQWLVVVLVRDGRPCEYGQEEFVMMQIYVLCLLFIGFVLSMHFLCSTCSTHSYSYTGPKNQQGRIQGTMVFVTLLLSVCVWVAWVAMFTRGNPELERRPQWDDPVLGLALVTNAWVLLLGHGLAQVSFLCKGESRSKEVPLSFAGWTSPSADIQDLMMKVLHHHHRRRIVFPVEAEQPRRITQHPPLPPFQVYCFPSSSSLWLNLWLQRHSAAVEGLSFSRFSPTLAGLWSKLWSKLWSRLWSRSGHLSSTQSSATDSISFRVGGSGLRSRSRSSCSQ